MFEIYLTAQLVSKNYIILSIYFTSLYHILFICGFMFDLKLEVQVFSKIILGIILIKLRYFLSLLLYSFQK